MNYLQKLKSYSTSDRIAYEHNGAVLTYRDMVKAAERLAKYIRREIGESELQVIPVYGHKDALMPITMFACTISGHAYCPIDISFTPQRIRDVRNTVECPLFFATETCPSEENIISREQIESIIGDASWDEVPAEGLYEMAPTDTVYVLFTSGSTGKPKGVKITSGNLNNYLNWIETVGTPKQHKRYLNQAPFSFDLSVMDFYLAFSTESTLYAVDKKDQMNYQDLQARLSGSDLNVWVSTPSFADMCLAMKDFNEEMLPDLELFLFCGEALTNKTCRRLSERFPKAMIYNTYGPTESTVCVTELLVTPEILEEYPILPIGTARPGTTIEVRVDGKPVPDGEYGEITIIGDTVSPGYYKNPEQTEKAFFKHVDGQQAYRTGDKGYYKDGHLFFCGRIDLQIKLHGYRIELEDIESNLIKVEGVVKACVLPKFDAENRVKHITGVVIYEGENSPAEAKKIQEELRRYVPEYMVPKRIRFVDEMPVNNNAKVDRKALTEMIEK